jgi:hypothetical protein
MDGAARLLELGSLHAVGSENRDRVASQLVRPGSSVRCRVSSWRLDSFAAWSWGRVKSSRRAIRRVRQVFDAHLDIARVRPTVHSMGSQAEARVDTSSRTATRPQRFCDRTDAGRLLAEQLRAYAGPDDVVVLGLPRGGVPVAFEVAQPLDAPLDVFLLRKLGVPGHEEYAFGTVATGGVLVLNRSLVESLSIDLLARRLIAAIEWLGTDVPASLPIGLFGASTGAAAALVAAAERADAVHAVVSRGGRPDLAGPALARVHAPTLLVVGGRDAQVLELKRQALHLLDAKENVHLPESKLELVRAYLLRSAAQLPVGASGRRRASAARAPSRQAPVRVLTTWSSPSTR